MDLKLRNGATNELSSEGGSGSSSSMTNGVSGSANGDVIEGVVNNHVVRELEGLSDPKKKQVTYDKGDELGVGPLDLGLSLGSVKKQEVVDDTGKALTASRAKSNLTSTSSHSQTLLSELRLKGLDNSVEVGLGLTRLVVKGDSDVGPLAGRENTEGTDRLRTLGKVDHTVLEANLEVVGRSSSTSRVKAARVGLRVDIHLKGEAGASKRDGRDVNLTRSAEPESGVEARQIAQQAVGFNATSIDEYEAQDEGREGDLLKRHDEECVHLCE